MSTNKPAIPASAVEATIDTALAAYRGVAFAGIGVPAPHLYFLQNSGSTVDIKSDFDASFYFTEPTGRGILEGAIRELNEGDVALSFDGILLVAEAWASSQEREEGETLEQAKAKFDSHPLPHDDPNRFEVVSMVLHLAGHKPLVRLYSINREDQSLSPLDLGDEVHGRLVDDAEWHDFNGDSKGENNA